MLSRFSNALLEIGVYMARMGLLLPGHQRDRAYCLRQPVITNQSHSQSVGISHSHGHFGVRCTYGLTDRNFVRRSSKDNGNETKILNLG